MSSREGKPSLLRTTVTTTDGRDPGSRGPLPPPTPLQSDNRQQATQQAQRARPQDRSPGPAEGGGGCVEAIAWTRVVRDQKVQVAGTGIQFLKIVERKGLSIRILSETNS